MYKIATLLFLGLLFTACGGSEMSLDEIINSENLEQIRAKRSEIKAEEMTLAEQLEQLDSEIARLDTLEKLPLITVSALTAENFTHFIELQGNVMTKKNLMIYPEYGGILTTVKVREGQNVSKGQVLALIDDGGLGQQRTQMKLQADLAKTTFEKQERLWNQKIGSEMQYLQAKTSYEAQAESVLQMDRQLAKTIVRAPFSGVIDEVITDQGSVVGPGTNPLMRIVSLRDMYVEVNVPENHLPKVQKGKTVLAEFPVLGREIESKVRFVGSYINPANRTFKVEISIPNNDNLIKPNLTAKVKINDYTNEKAVLIPQSVMSEDADGKEYVYITKDQNGNKAQVERAYIETGLTKGDKIEVLSGLADGASLVIEGARAIRDGITVKIISQ